MIRSCIATCSATFFTTFFLLSYSAPLVAQITIVDDNFEAGSFSTDWDTTGGTGTTIVNSIGDGAGGSDGYARVEGVGAGSGGLGVSLAHVVPGSDFSTDFSATFDFRIENTASRQFNFQISSTSSTPNTNAATINLRYQASGGGWAAFGGGAWNSIASLGTVTPGEWNSLTITGNNWGSQIDGTADFDISFTDNLNATTNATGLQFFQSGNPDTAGALSLNFNDRFGSNSGFDLDNVQLAATPATPAPATTVITPTAPVAYSGIYPHTAVSSTHGETGIGAIINRNGTIFYTTYGPHITSGGTDRLYAVDTTTLSHTTYNNYPGNTDANRYRDTNLGIDVIGAAYIDTNDTVRFLPVTNFAAGDLVGRITGTAAHLTDPNKLYYMTMEEGLYEVDFSNLNSPVITTLRVDGNFDGQPSVSGNLPGAHGKGLFTGQGHLFFTNNGAGEGFRGGLVEWDGTGDPALQSTWTLVDTTSQYTEVTSRRGPVDMDPASTDAIWATGWDDASMFINTRDAATGQWTKFRLPKSSYTHGHPNGWYTEWPRIRDVGLDGGYLMSHHGMMFLVPEDFSATNPAGITPVTTHLKMIVDYVDNGTQLVLAADDASQFANGFVPRANSNIQFIDKANLANYGGKPSGFGGFWVNDSLAAGTNSDAFLINGFTRRVVHFEHESANPVDFVLEVDANGDGNWTQQSTFTVPGTSGGGSGYGYYILPKTLNAQWLRVRATSNVTSATAYLHMSNGGVTTNAQQLASLANPAAPAARSQGVLRSLGGTDLKLEFAADKLDASGNITGTGYYQAQLNPTTYQLELVAVNDATAEANLRSGAATTQDYTVDAASVIVVDGGTRYRLPKGNAAFDSSTASGWRRGEREVVTERALLNVHGTIYEVPRNFTGGGFERIRPVTTHNRDIFDFMSWRGMLVLSGNNLDATEDGHYVQSDDGEVGLWFGNVDDLWSFGAPEGEGGPWKDTPVTAGIASDQYLMAGYDDKLLELSHTAPTDVEFTIEVDFLGTNQWEEYGRLSVAAGETLAYQFEEGYSAHWVRLISDTDTTATAWFTYTASLDVATADFDHDGDVDGDDFLAWQRGFGIESNAENADGDSDFDGDVDGDDFLNWQRQFDPASAANSSASAVPEPASLFLMAIALSMSYWQLRM